MSQASIKFIASDMDGTLLDQYGRLDPEFFDVFLRLEEQGILFSAASGRQYYSLRDTFAPIQDRILYVAENGTLVIHKDKELYSCTIPKPEVAEIIKAARGIDGAHIVLCGKRSAYIEIQDQKTLEEFQKYYHRCENVDDLLQVDDEFIKVAICHFDGSEELVFPTMNGQFGDSHKVVVSAKIWLDVMNAKASKGAAIQYLQQTMNFTPAETMTFGDYLNDLEMLQVSEHSYAVANAHEEIKKIARFSAPSNQESGVLTVLKEKFLNN
ncbi:Cof-type HAD-IIB family hydrolase [Vibrio natriegens]|jgi:Cof subfamily protein (haloacid dehalogenase superfamily)|uniref:HAD family hydrolase n=1 Tax=Vibrio natriegens NBRC 15636 = ATCC 14048 = DSM 759 TaxID=1219067 RepID=A0AAN0Y7L6_VIBNA|nr:Cof-type HAD-IIB family hydrolase [Vibrio natriegens]ALR17587.1 HAD family hydrolase [Vibrio natriegens NBRC 15636 = ATCC 14048 = DSM 759]ANQ15077.1 HAD family hydrolase [Vibrio natriegens NBRC 15636 = ATCC 14048 = DSM 759]EPM40072.1 HAD family hydrolase [Vibrio natriegens NBRC 15636 = ATCC 14048 = DSM 759]MDX6029587.1 Cof-type HAD-IIB family hydrolase [Vibrio natriegens NBRC 15636 = ATCC 14048 = DSM 759]UUI13718.1 Cof-type HAD-IIB family hydrolase [Vibrio natriegens]